jgi:hypothetical protein
MKKTIALLTIVGAFIDTVFELNLLESIGITGVYAGYVKFFGLLVSTSLAYYTQAPTNKDDIGGTNQPAPKDEK